MSQVIQETKEKPRKTGNIFCTKLYLTVEGVTANFNRDRPSSVTTTNLNEAASTASA